MPSRRVQLAVAGCVIVLVMAFFLAPVVPHTRQVVLQYDGGSLGCTATTGTSSSTGDQEVLLHPLTYTPDGYANFLRDYAPGHWLALVNLYYTRFGYFIGQGPYYRVAVPYSVYEIPHAGLTFQSSSLTRAAPPL